MMSFCCFLLQKKMKKKLVGLTREHEALFNFVEHNKQICTEKEKQKVQYVSSYQASFYHFIHVFIVWEWTLAGKTANMFAKGLFFLFSNTDVEQAD